MKYIDLTHTFTSDMPVYPGDFVPEIVQVSNLRKDGYTDFQIKTGMHVGTHIDGPLHMLAGGEHLSEVSVDNFFGEGYLIDAREKTAIDESVLTSVSVKKGGIVLVMTGFDKKYRQTEYFESYPEMTEGFAQRVIDLGVKMVGMDTPSPDRPPFKIHKLLLGQGILIIEDMANLEELLGVGPFEVVALPPKFYAEAAPARVVARVK